MLLVLLSLRHDFNEEACSVLRSFCDGLLQVIRQAFPHHALLGEEGGASGDVNSDFLWCIDPLDGAHFRWSRSLPACCSVHQGS